MKNQTTELVKDFEQLINQDLEKAMEDLKEFKEKTKELAVYNRDQDKDFTTNYLETDTKQSIFEDSLNPSTLLLRENSQN